MSEALLPATVTCALTQDEVLFVYNLEVLGMPGKVAAAQAGVSYGLICKPHIMQARETLKREMRGSLPSKEDIAHMMLDAVGRARILSEPATEILGLEKVAKLLGYDAPQKIDINLNATLEVLQSSVRTMPTADLIKAVPGASDIIDAEFYEVG